MLGLEDEDSLDKLEMGNSPPPLSPQTSPRPVTPPAPSAPPKLHGKSPHSDGENIKAEKPKLSKPSKKSAETPQFNGHDNSSDTETEATDNKKLTTTSSENDKSAKKRRKSEKKAKSKEVINTTDSESDTEGGEPPSKVLATSDKNTKSALENIPSDIRFEPKNLLVKPKGLVDALSNFFTPGLKRTSRTAMNSLIKPESQSIAKTDGKVPDDVKKVRLSVDEKEESSKSGDSKSEERKRHASAGQQQVKSLYDGLSHLYNDCDSRLRSAPKDQKDPKETSDKREKSSEDKDVDSAKATEEKAGSPLRMSDSERKEKEEDKKEDPKTEDEDKAKGTSKDLHEDILFSLHDLELRFSEGLYFVSRLSGVAAKENAKLFTLNWPDTKYIPDILSLVDHNNTN